MQDDTSAIRFNPSKNGYYREDSKTRPSGAAGKDFKKIMGQEERDSKGSGKKQIKGEEDLVEAEDLEVQENEVEKTLTTSLFDMQKAKAKPAKTIHMAGDGATKALKPQQKNKEGVDDLDPDDQPIDTNHIGEAKEAAKKAHVPSGPFDLVAATTAESREDKKIKKTQASSLFAREQPDLATVNPLAGIQPSDISLNAELKADKPIVPVKSIQELINQMVKEVQSMESEGKTDTTVTLRHPPIFEGAQLVVTSFSSARGEFNISFENLSQAAQQLLSLAHTKESLLNTLEQKGYHVHILMATTLDEQRIFTASAEGKGQDREERRQEREGQGDRQREGQEEQA